MIFFLIYPKNNKITIRFKYFVLKFCNLNIIFYIILLFLLFYFYNIFDSEEYDQTENTKDLEKKVNTEILPKRKKPKDPTYCSWSAGPFPKDYDHNRTEECQLAIRFLNNLNVTYFLLWGSALGAVRNGGLIGKDSDVDVAIPVWLNPHIFGCSEYHSIKNKDYDNKNVYMARNYRPCGHTRFYYHLLFKKYIRKHNKDNGRISSHICIGNTQVYLSERMYTDLWIILNNEYVYREIDICKCKFCGIDSYALEKSILYSQIMYGEDCMTEQKAYKGLEQLDIEKPE